MRLFMFNISSLSKKTDDLTRHTRNILITEPSQVRTKHSLTNFALAVRPPRGLIAKPHIKSVVPSIIFEILSISYCRAIVIASIKETRRIRKMSSNGR